MNLTTIQKLGGIALIAGAALFAVYSMLFAALLPTAAMWTDLTLLVNHQAWVPLTGVAFVGILLMMGGFAAVYTRLRPGSGLVAFAGLIVIELAYVLQAAKVTWEMLVYPVLVSDARFAPLLRDAILRDAPGTVMARYAMMGTIFAGIVLFSLSLLRSTAFPKAGGALAITGALLYGLGPRLGAYGWLLGVFVLGAGCTVLGVALLRPAAARVESVPVAPAMSACAE